MVDSRVIVDWGFLIYRDEPITNQKSAITNESPVNNH